MGNSGHSIIKRSSPPTTAYCRMEQEQQRITEQPEGTDLWIPPDPGRARTGSDMSFHQLLKEEIRTLFQKLKCGLCNSPPVPFNLYNVGLDNPFPQASTQSCTPGLSQAISLCHPWGTWWLVMACLVSHSHREPVLVPRATPDWWSYWTPQPASHTPSLCRSVHSALWAFASEFSNWFSFTSSSSWYYSFCIFLSACISPFLPQVSVLSMSLSGSVQGLEHGLWVQKAWVRPAHLTQANFIHGLSRFKSLFLQMGR